MKYSCARTTNRSSQRNRRSIRLPGYDYSRAGAYFVTLCTQGRSCLFGNIVDGEVWLNRFGAIVAEEWLRSAEIRDEIELDEWVIMPNHFHGIVVITDKTGDPRCTGDRPVAPTGPRPNSIGALTGGFKSAVTRRINELRNMPGQKVWQRNYWEHIVRNELELARIREYIQNNPAQWELDALNPSNVRAPGGHPNP